MPILDIVIPSYNSGTTLRQTLDGVLSQSYSESWQPRVTVVDDSSTDHSFEHLPKNILDTVQIIKLEQNMGRSIARNIGAHSGNGDYILFLDSDCEPKNHKCFQTLINNLHNQYDVLYASVQTKGSGFWANYFNKLSSKREEIALQGSLQGFTSQYFIVSRNYFESSGSFNENYQTYGFEDIDLILRLQNSGAKIGYIPESVVFHEEVGNLSMITNKLMEAGQFSSVIFESSHPSEYRKMKYGRIDARLNPITIKPLIYILLPFYKPIIFVNDALIRNKLFPTSLKSVIVKLSSALAYSIGTLKAKI